MSTLLLLLAVNPASADLRQQYNQEQQQLNSEKKKCLEMASRAQYFSDRHPFWLHRNGAYYFLIDDPNFHYIVINKRGDCSIQLSALFDREFMDEHRFIRQFTIEDGKIVDYTRTDTGVKRYVMETFKRIK